MSHTFEESGGSVRMTYDAHENPTDEGCRSYFRKMRADQVEKCDVPPRRKHRDTIGIRRGVRYRERTIRRKISHNFLLAPCLHKEIRDEIRHALLGTTHSSRKALSPSIRVFAAHNFYYQLIQLFLTHDISNVRVIFIESMFLYIIDKFITTRVSKCCRRASLTLQSFIISPHAGLKSLAAKTYRKVRV